jgi:hypothetical protein
MRYLTRSVAICATLLLFSTGDAAEMNGKLPMYPNGRNLNQMPASAVAAGVPMVLETDDSLAVVDAWYGSNATGCARSAQSGGIKYQCQTGSIMIYVKGKTQIALVPAFPHL